MIVIGIDPGLEGYFFRMSDNQDERFQMAPMPVKGGKKKEIDFDGVCALLEEMVLPGECHVYLERSIGFNMGTQAAFNYGRGFAAIEIAIKLHAVPVTYVEPRKWTKEIFEGIDSRLKPKEQSQIAVERLFPTLASGLPKKKNGRYHEGAVDALLIAGYGLRKAGKT